MLASFTALAPLLVGAVLIWAAVIKLFGRHAAAAARRSALVSLIGEQRALPAYRILGGVELATGALLVLPPVLWLEAVAATGLTVGFLGYLIYARVAAPEASCGCLSAQRAPVTWRSLLRAGMLLFGSLLAVPATESWWETLAAHPLAGTTALLGAAAVIVALSAELDTVWLLPIRQLRAHLTHPLRGGFGVPLLATVQQLQRSDAYRRVAGAISSDVREHWDDGQWRMVCHAARYQGRPTTAVFAVPLSSNAPDDVRVAIVDDVTGATLWSFPDMPAAVERPAQPAPGLALGTS